MLSHILLHCSDALCMKLRIYKGKHDKYCTSFTLFFNNLYCMNCIYNVVVVVVVVENKFQFNSIQFYTLKSSSILNSDHRIPEHFQHHNGPEGYFYWCVMEIVSMITWQWIFALQKITFDNRFCLRMNFPSELFSSTSETVPWTRMVR